MVASLSVISSWLTNKTQAYAEDLILPLSLCLINGLVISIIFARKFYKNRFAAIVWAVLIIITINQNFDSILTRINPGLDLHSFLGLIFSFAVSVLIIMLGLSASFLTDKYTNSWQQQTQILYKAILIIITIPFLIQLALVTVTIAKLWPQYFYHPPKLASASNASLIPKPDIYYIILDRYASQSVLREQFNYDNADFLGYLASNGFSVNPSALSNYPFTAMSVASTLSADYNSDLVQKFAISKDQSLVPYYDSIRNSPVISELKSLGYSYSLLSSWYEATNQSEVADDLYQPDGDLTIFGHRIILNGFSKNILNQSFWELIARHGLTIGRTKILAYNTISEADATPYKLDQLKRLADAPYGGRFIFAHILVPHDPYYFNANGSRNSNSDSNDIGEPIKQKYINQIEYINDQMKDVINRIEKNSGNQAIIILQSDEGPYPTQLQLDDESSRSIIDDDLSTVDMRTWSDQNLKMKYGILAAYQIPKAKTEDLQVPSDSANIFRLVLNTYFGTNMPYLPKCYYALPNGKDLPFKYDDITSRLTGQANPACPKNSNFSGR